MDGVLKYTDCLFEDTGCKERILRKNVAREAFYSNLVTNYYLLFFSEREQIMVKRKKNLFTPFHWYLFSAL